MTYKAKMAPGYRHENHAKPVTRRQLLAQGCLGATGFVATSSILSLLFERYALGNTVAPSCALAASSGMTPVIVFDCAGGLNMGRNFIVGRDGSQSRFVSPNGYATLGLSAGLHPGQPGMAVGIAGGGAGLLMHRDSAILAGLQGAARPPHVRTFDRTTGVGAAAPEVLSRLDGAIFCSVTNDDTSNNQHSPVYWLNKAGAEGSLASILGTAAGRSGGNSDVPSMSVNPSAQPVRITSPASVGSLADLGRLASLLSRDEALGILRAAERMSGDQLRRFTTESLPEQVRQLVECGYIQNTKVAETLTAENINPANNPTVTSIFNLGNTFNREGGGTGPNTIEMRTGSVVSSVLSGYAGVGVVSLGGYDYHGAANFDAQLTRDWELGTMINKTVRLAAAMEKDVVIYIISDGSVGCAGTAINGIVPATSDSEDRSLTAMLVYKHGSGNDRVATRISRQIGSYADNGTVVRRGSIIGDSPENLARAITANYLALHGQESKVLSVTGSDPFGSQLEKYLAFGKMRG